MLRKLIPALFAIVGILVLAGCGAKDSATSGTGAETPAANAGGGAKPGGAGAGGGDAKGGGAKLLYSPKDVELMKKGVAAFQASVKKDAKDPKAKDLADNYCKNLLAAGPGPKGLNREFPTDKPAEQGRWIFEKETIVAGIDMLGGEGKGLRDKIVAQYNKAVDPIKGDQAKKDAIQKAWRFPIKWSL